MFFLTLPNRERATVRTLRILVIASRKVVSVRTRSVVRSLCGRRANHHVRVLVRASHGVRRTREQASINQLVHNERAVSDGLENQVVGSCPAGSEICRNARAIRHVRRRSTLFNGHDSHLPKVVLAVDNDVLLYLAPANCVSAVVATSIQIESQSASITRNVLNNTGQLRARSLAHAVKDGEVEVVGVVNLNRKARERRLLANPTRQRTSRDNRGRASRCVELRHCAGERFGTSGELSGRCDGIIVLPAEISLFAICSARKASTRVSVASIA